MSAYDDRLDELRDRAHAALDAIAGISGDDHEPHGEAVARLERVLGYAVVALDAAEGDLLAETARTELQAQFNQYAADPHAAIANAEPWADGLLVSLARLPLARDHDFAQQAREAAANYQHSVQQRVHALDNDFAATRDRITEIGTEADQRQTVISQQVDALAASFEARLAEFDQTLANERSNIEQTKTSQAETFRTAQDDRAETFRSRQNERDEAFKAAQDERDHSFDESRGEFSKLLDQSKREVDSLVEDIRRMESESSALVGAIGLAGTAERYGEEVKQQRKAADIWRRTTVGLAALAAIAVIVVAVTLGRNPKWEDFLGKLTASALIGGVAAYAARQSARHREREERARNFQLELTAFSPFIEPLSVDQQEEERVVMTRKTFGKANTQATADEEPGPHPLSFVLRRKERTDDSE